MLTLLSVYSESARQDFLLPAAENVTLCARAERFGLGRDIALTLSAAGGWHFTGPCTASLRHAGVPYADQPLKAGDSLAYYLSGRVALVLLVRQQASPFAAYDRYRVRPGSIYIGSAADCGLQFTFSSGGQQYITQYHAELRFDGTSFGICDRSRNGVFVNGRRVRGSAALAFGDEVDIWGLSLVILNGGLAVRRTPGLTVASGVLTPGNQPAVPLPFSQFGYLTFSRKEKHLEPHHNKISKLSINTQCQRNIPSQSPRFARSNIFTHHSTLAWISSLDFTERFRK